MGVCIYLSQYFFSLTSQAPRIRSIRAPRTIPITYPTTNPAITPVAAPRTPHVTAPTVPRELDTKFSVKTTPEPTVTTPSMAAAMASVAPPSKALSMVSTTTRTRAIRIARNVPASFRFSTILVSAVVRPAFSMTCAWTIAYEWTPSLFPARSGYNSSTTACNAPLYA
ncbi:hypothetical protein FB451DRAFT_1241244 [Mycena latifolia]|nr:hypothetical protein FB451DRAFT_1241244 [Mycena latifolia]